MSQQQKKHKYKLPKTKMDLDFIEQKDRDNIFKLMQVCGIEMAEAYELYINAGSSFETAMQMHFNEGPKQGVGQGFGQGFGQQGQGKVEGYQGYVGEGDDDFDTMYEKFKVYKNSGAKFENRYEVRKNSSFLGSLVPKFLKGAPQSNFKKSLQNYLGRPCAIQFSAESLSCTLAQSDKFPIAVFILDFLPAARAKLQQILRNSQFVEMVNVQYRNIGIDPSYELQKSLAKFVDRKKYNNSLVILRVNAIEEVEIISHIPLTTAGITVKEVLEKLKLAKNACISKDMDEVHLERRLHQELLGNFQYEKPMSIAERRKVAQDRQIRKKQEEEFFASMKAQEKKQQKPETTTTTKVPQSQPQPHSQPQYNPQPIPKAPQQKQQPPKRNLPEQRRLQRQSLKLYTEGMHIRLRLPNGQAMVVTVDSNQKASYLYRFVESIERDIGFEKDQNRKFDIIRPYDKLNLSENLGRTLGEVFQGSESENLVVGQKD